MSMAVDLSTPLTRDERAYLAHRGRYAEIERADSMHGVTGVPLPEGDGTGPEMVPLMTAEQRAGEAERLRKRLAELEAADSGQADGDDDELPPYESWNVKDLDAELKRRNLPVTGDKRAKADALYSNDEQFSA